MPTETEDYIDEEVVRDTERGVEAEDASEFERDEELEDEREIIKETDDPALQDILKHTGGYPEDWELTHKGTAEYFFNGSEVINAKTGESWTKQIESASDEANIAVHHAMLEQWKQGESLTRLPDFEEEKKNGDVVLHVTHMRRSADNSVSYEIRSTVISRREEEEIFATSEEVERMETCAHVAFEENRETTTQEYAALVSETQEYINETAVDGSNPVDANVETQTVQEAAPTMHIEERIDTGHEHPVQEIVSVNTPQETERENRVQETTFENATGEIAGKKEEEAAPDAWLYDLLKDNILVRAERHTYTQGSAPVMESVEKKIDVEVVAERPAIVQSEIVSIEQPARRSESFVTPRIEIRSFEKPATREMREAVVPKIEQKQDIEKATASTGKHGVKTIAEPVVKSEETIDGPTIAEPKLERALNGQEILLRALGLPTPPTGELRVQTHAFAHVEGLRPTRYYSSPQNNDQTTTQPRVRVNTLNGIRMRKAA